ncbi:MAG: esterase-like activity of phytase family protein [Phyllobacteriaceae bacterium]|nr:esterase-like activity of phytase family protein [Phyllobacteriaceae bacterium]
MTRLTLLLAALLAATAPVLADAPVKALTIAARPIVNFAIGSSETRFGKLDFVGGLELTSDDDDLGALSAFRFLSPGRDFIGVADTGFWYTGRLDHDASGKPVGVSAFAMQEMVDRDGAVIGKKWLTDAEGLSVDGARVTASFERDHRVSEYALSATGMGAPKRDVPFLVPAGELRQNRGFETIALSPKDGPLAGARVLVSEKSLDKKGDIFAAVIEGPKKGVFAVTRSGEFDITDGAFLPGGDLLLLERSYSMASGVKMRLRRFRSGDIGPGARIDGDIVMQADMAYQIDNMEGLDVWTRADGATMVSLISDDNHSLLQRSLYLEFSLRDE